MEAKNIVLIVLVLLLVFAAVQAFQVSSLKEKITGKAASVPAGQNAQAPVQSAPVSTGMVGGC